MTKILRSDCPVGKSCPRIEKSEEGWYDVVGSLVPDDSLPAHERRVRVPETMLPELGRLDIPDFEAWLAERRSAPGDMLRIQTLPQYGVPSDDADFAGYLNGAPAPTSEYREPFFQELRDGAAAGRVWRNLVVIDGEPTPYQKYANEWVYTSASEAGQVIRILDLADHPVAAALLRTGDFWVVEHHYVALVRYDDQGHHLGEVAVEDSGAHGYVAAGELAWELGVPFAQWWAAHPEYRRSHLAA